MADLEFPIEECVECYLKEKEITMTEVQHKQFADRVRHSVETQEKVFSIRSTTIMLTAIEKEYAHQIEKAMSDHRKIEEEDAAMAKVEETLEKEVEDLEKTLDNMQKTSERIKQMF
jgi:hypothetical protein